MLELQIILHLYNGLSKFDWNSAVFNRKNQIRILKIRYIFFLRHKIFYIIIYLLLNLCNNKKNVILGFCNTKSKIIFEQLTSFGSSRKSSGVVGARIALLKLTSRCWPIFTERLRRAAHPNNFRMEIQSDSIPIFYPILSPIISQILASLFIKTLQRFHLIGYEARTG